jgi:hypothetical protein
MERFPRGSIPPASFAAIATVAPTAVSKPPEIAVPMHVEALGTEGTAVPHEGDVADDVVKQSDLSTTCPNCNSQMQPEHAHYRCLACGYRDSCCF